MKVVHIIAGAETGGGKVHLISILSKSDKENTELLVFEEGLIAQEARELGISVTVLNQSNRFDLTASKKISSFIKENGFDIVHSHGARANLYMTFVKNLKFKWIITVHSDPHLDFMGRGVSGAVYTKLNVMALKKADHLITVSSKIRQILKEDNFDLKKITTINNGIEFDYNGVRPKAQNKSFTLTYIARLHPVKRHTYLIDALKETGLSDFKLNLIGDGEEHDSVVKAVEEAGFKGNVEMHGYLSKDKIESILRKSDISVLTSQSETFPLVLLESANQQVPFISTNVGDVKIIDPFNKYSWIVDINDKKELVAAINEAYNEWKQGALFEKGIGLYEEVSRKFTLDKMVSSIEKVYYKIISN